MSTLLHRLPRALPLSFRTFSTSSTRSSFAKMTIIGRLADTPELQATSTGQEILRYAVGTNSGPRDNQKTSWFRVTSFLPEGPQRDFIAGLDKGTLVYVEGEASMSQYTDAEGKPRSALNLIQQKLEVLSPKKPTQ
ncbi:ssDNA binding protein [Hyaloscypha hepaticicola]|uniref:SsDNA binding protein n=1 Tax=Hyaloscypha hepaticicola TaxID=2082293 RepID=A0A2J6QD97_9HELO|nr:ssDNA binding protein [Hyaloscypha hepaticicola]